jgi:hypothetical protein
VRRMGLSGMSLGIFLLLACDGQRTLRFDSWPQRVRGALEIAVEDGDVDPDDISEINFGRIRTGAGTVFIELEADVIRKSGLRRDELFEDLVVEAMLSGPSKYSTWQHPSYRVSSLSRVER